MESHSREKVHKIKLIQFQGRSTPIILQNEDGPCALVAICNNLLLKNIFPLSWKISEISQKDLLSLVGRQLQLINVDEEQQQDKYDAFTMLPKLATGIIFNIRFKGITDFEVTSEFAPFRLLNIPIYHGWIVDPEDSDTYSAIGSKSYDSIMLDLIPATTATTGGPSPGLSKGRSFDVSTGSVSKHKKVGNGDLEEEASLLRALELSKVNYSYSPEDESLDSSDARKEDLKEEDRLLRATELSYGITSQGLIQDFVLGKNANQLTVYGLSCLQNELKEHEICILFRNNHFNTMFKFRGQLYLLLTDEGYIDKPDLVWEMLNKVDGNTTFVNESFEEFKEPIASYNDAAPDISVSNSDTVERALQEQELEQQPIVPGASQLVTVTGPQGLGEIQSKSRKLIEMEPEFIERLINSVSDNDEEFKNFCLVLHPLEDSMVKEKFPLKKFERPTMAWCCENLKHFHNKRKNAGEVGHELINAWSNLYYDGEISNGQPFFTKFSNKKQNKYINLMLDDIERSQAPLHYRKWMFALWKEERHDFRDGEPVGGKEGDVTGTSRKFKIRMGQEEITDLILSVKNDDKEFKKFSITTPSADEMLEENFPLFKFTRVAVEWCCRNLKLKSISNTKKDAAESGREWHNAWNNLHQKDMLKDKRNFCEYTKKQQQRNIDQMLCDIEESKRRLSYRKWKFALKKRDSESIGGVKEDDVTESSDESKIRMGQKEITDLIRSVKNDDTEFKKFSITTPSADEMLEENFPLFKFTRVAVEWCCRNLKLKSISNTKKDAAERGREWHNAWNNLHQKDMLKDKRNFCEYTKKQQHRNIDQMLCDIEESKRRLSYRKWKFALKKRDSESIGGVKEDDVTESSDESKDQKSVGGQKEGDVTRSFEEFKEPIATIDDAALDDSVSKNLALKERHDFQDRELVGGEEGNVRNFEEFKEPIASIIEATHDISVTKFSPIFPIFLDNDVVRPYKEPFSLEFWLNSHKAINSRWRRTVEEVDGLDIQLWNGDRPKRESLAIMQSLLSAVLDYHCRTGRPLGNLRDHSNIFLTQCTHSFLGFQQVRFEITFPEPLELDGNLLGNLAKDMKEVGKIFQKILHGKELNSELKYLLSDLLETYPPPQNRQWKTQLLHNYTGLWDGRSRRCFMILLFYTLVCEMEGKYSRKITGAISGIRTSEKNNLTTHGWVKRIRENDSVFYKILTYKRVPETVDPESKEPLPPQRRYKETVTDAIKYYRDCLHHHKDAHCSMNLNDLEVCLTNLFPGLVLHSYLGMCKKRNFLV